MAALLVATANDGGGHVSLALTGVTSGMAPTGKVRLYRIDAAGTLTPVRNGDTATLSGEAWSGQDYEIPLDTLVSYSARNESSGAVIVNSSSVIVASGEEPWLGHPGVPALNIRPIVKAFSPGTRKARATSHDVIGRTFPIGQSLRRGGYAGTLELWVNGQSELDAIDDLLDDGSVLLYRAPASWIHHGTRYLQVGDTDHSKALRISTDGRYSVTLPWVEVARPAGLAAAGPGSRWADVLITYPNWASVSVGNPTWADVLNGVP